MRSLDEIKLAWAKGETIQSRFKSLDSPWTDWGSDTYISFNPTSYEYRVKPSERKVFCYYFFYYDGRGKGRAHVLNSETLEEATEIRDKLSRLKGFSILSDVIEVTFTVGTFPINEALSEYYRGLI